MSSKEPSVEEIELWFRKVARGEVPREGDVLLRVNRGWVFSPPLVDVADIRWDGDYPGNVKAIGDAGFVKLSGSNAVPPGEADIYEEILQQGPGNIIEEDLANGELLFKVGGLYTVSGVVTYSDLTQPSQLNIMLRRGDLVAPIASEQIDLAVALPFVVEVVQLSVFFKQGDVVWLEFGRSGGQNFTADIINVDFLAYVVALDRRL